MSEDDGDVSEDGGDASEDGGEQYRTVQADGDEHQLCEPGPRRHGGGPPKRGAIVGVETVETRRIEEGAGDHLEPGGGS